MRETAHRDNSFLAGLETPGETTHGPTQAFAQRRPHLPLCFEESTNRLDSLQTAHHRGASTYQYKESPGGVEQKHKLADFFSRASSTARSI